MIFKIIFVVLLVLVEQLLELLMHPMIKQTVIGFPAIKGFEQLEKDINNWTNATNCIFINDYVGNGYAKINKDLVDFINEFNARHNIPLDSIYTGKMMMGILDLVAKDYLLKRKFYFSNTHRWFAR